MSPIGVMWYLQMGRKHVLSSWRAVQYSLLTMYFSYVFAEIDCFFIKLFKNWDWESLVTLQLPPDCWVVFLTNESEKQSFIIFCTNLQEGKKFQIWTGHVTMTKKGKKHAIWKCHVTMNRSGAYISNKVQLQNHSLTFIHKNKSLPLATSVLSSSPTAYNTTASLDKVTCTDYVEFGNVQDKFGRFSWSKKDSKY